jgi:hypothetical protein
MRSLSDVLYNFHWIAPGRAARSSQAYVRLLTPFLRARRIRTLINLRGANPDWGWWHYERRVCAALGISHVDVKLSSKRLPTRDMVLSLLAAFDGAETPFLLKCSGGQDRTSFAAALYLVHSGGWSAFEAAQAQFARWPYLHLPRRDQRWLKQFLLFAKADADGRTLREWVSGLYSPERFKAWLEARGEAASFRNVYASPQGQ